MAKRNIFRGLAAVLALGMCMTGLAGCGSEKRADGKTEIEVVSYKPEAVKAFEKIEILPFSYIDTHSKGDVVSRVIADVDQLSDGLLMGFTQFFTWCYHDYRYARIYA